MKYYEERGGGHSQKEALKVAIEVLEGCYVRKMSVEEMRQVIQKIGYSETGKYLNFDMNNFEKRVDKATKAIFNAQGGKR